MRLSELLREDLVKIGLEGEDKEEVFEEMVHLLVQSGSLADREEALTALWEREKMMTTGIGKGLAIPHGKVASKIGLKVAMGISPEGIDYESLDHEPVYVVLMVFSQDDDPGPHIQALAEISRLFSVPGFTDRVRSVKSYDELIEMIKAEE